MLHHPQHFLVHLLVEPQRIVQPVGLVEVARDDALELFDGVGLVGAIIDHRAFDAGAPAGPGLALLVARRHEHHELAFRMARREYRDRFGLGETRQIVEIAVLTVDELDIVGAHRDRRAGKDRDRALADRAQQMRAAFAEDFSVAVRAID